MRFHPGQKVVCNAKAHEILSVNFGSRAKHFPEFNQIYTVEEYTYQKYDTWLIRIREMPPSIVYDEDLFDPLDEDAVAEARKILEQVTAEG